MDYNDPNDYWLQHGYDPYKGMTDDERTKAGCLQLAACVVTFVVALLLCAVLFASCSAQERMVSAPEVHEHWHHTTDTIHKTDSFIDRQKTTIREVDSATMAGYGVQMKQMQRAWLVETDRLRQVISELRMTKHDTVHELDSIPYPVEVVREVERGHTFGDMMLIAMAVTAVVLLFIFARKV